MFALPHSSVAARIVGTEKVLKEAGGPVKKRASTANNAPTGGKVVAPGTLGARPESPKITSGLCKATRMRWTSSRRSTIFTPKSKWWTLQHC